jgi:hypothetical protein
MKKKKEFHIGRVNTIVENSEKAIEGEDLETIKVLGKVLVEQLEGTF